MDTLGPYMPLPNNFAKRKSKSKKKFRKSIIALGRKLYVQAYLVCVGIMIASDLHVYKGEISFKFILWKFFTSSNRIASN